EYRQKEAIGTCNEVLTIKEVGHLISILHAKSFILSWKMTPTHQAQENEDTEHSTAVMSGEAFSPNNKKSLYRMQCHKHESCRPYCGLRETRPPGPLDHCHPLGE
ncbi:mCG145302, partial [Mus musculus]